MVKIMLNNLAHREVEIIEGSYLNTKAIITDPVSFMGYVAGATAIMLDVSCAVYLTTLWLV